MSQETDRRNDNNKKDYYLERVYRCNQADCRYNNHYGYLTPFSDDMLKHLGMEHDILDPELYLDEED